MPPTQNILHLTGFWLLEKVNIKIGGEGVRGVVNRLMCKVQDKMLQDNSDDYETLNVVMLSLQK